MKPVLTGLVLLLSLSWLHAQSERLVDIPLPVLDQFRLSYPDAQNIEWKAQHGKYLALFRNYKMNTAAMLSEDGTMLQTETEIKTIALPLHATLFLKEEIGVRKIEYASIVENESGVITFKARADKAQYWFDSDGQLFNQTGMASGIVSAPHTN